MRKRLGLAAEGRESAAQGASKRERDFRESLEVDSAD